MSQENLAAILGITFQQVQKYEKGKNRVGAGRLLEIATALKVPVAYFFEGYANDLADNDLETNLQQLMSTREGLAFARAFVRIANPAVRQSLVTMAEAMAGSGMLQDAAE